MGRAKEIWAAEFEDEAQKMMDNDISPGEFEAWAKKRSYCQEEIWNCIAEYELQNETRWERQQERLMEDPPKTDYEIRVEMEKIQRELKR